MGSTERVLDGARWLDVETCRLAFEDASLGERPERALERAGAPRLTLDQLGLRFRRHLCSSIRAPGVLRGIDLRQWDFWENGPTSITLRGKKATICTVQIDDAPALHLAGAEDGRQKSEGAVARIGGHSPRGCASAREGRVLLYFVRRGAFETGTIARPERSGSHVLVPPPPERPERANTPATARVPCNWQERGPR